MAEAIPQKFKVTVTGTGMKIDQEVDQATALEIVGVLLGGGEVSGETPSHRARSRTSARRRPGQRSQAKRKAPAKRKTGGRSRSPGMVKDLKLRPSGKKGFKEFADEKTPTTHQEQQAVIVFWLQHIAGIQGITVAHINTCYQNANWRRPANLMNSLAVTATKKGWLDTGDMDNITISSSGEDYVRHDLPHEPKAKKK
jgi:hypothetical protein